MHRSQDDFEEEIRAHLELEADALTREGVAAVDAMSAARRRFGNAARASETFYLSRSGRWFDALRSDARLGVRVLARAPLTTAVAIVVLAIGIGATTALYAAISAVVLRPLPFRTPDRLVAVGVQSRNQTTTRAGASAADFLDWQDQLRSVEALAAYRAWGYELDSDVEPERVSGARVTPDIFAMLGVTVVRGRSFARDDAMEGREHVVILSDSLWRRRYGGAPALVGSNIRLNGAPYTVVGIVAAGTMLPDAALWTPLVFAPYERTQRGDRPLTVIGRLTPSATFTSAAQELQRVMRELGERYPDADAGWDARVIALQHEIVGDSRQALLVLFVATCSLLAVACANLANLLLARGVARRRELALRAALGASHGRVVRQLVTESAILVCGGVAVGLVFAVLATRWLSALGPEFLPRAQAIAVDATVIAFAGGLAILAGAGLASLTGRLVRTLHIGTAMRGATPARAAGMFTLRDLFVVAQVAVALVLLVDGELLVQSFRRIQRLELGFVPQGMLTATISLPQGRYQHAEQRMQFFDAAMDRLSVTPGVQSVGIASRVPLAAGAAAGIMSTIVEDGEGEHRGADSPRAATVVVGGSYFSTARIPLIAGRSFSSSDRPGAPGVLIVDRTLARRLGGERKVIGMRVHIAGGTGGDTTQREIIGVVGAVRLANIVDDPEAVLYLPYSQTSWPTMNLFVRLATDPRAFTQSLRSVIASVDPTRPLYNVRPLADGVDRAMASRRFQMLLLTGFAMSALLLATLGVYGIFTFSVMERRREIGIRIALGASVVQVRSLVLRHALVRIVAGLLVGAVVAVSVGGLLRGQLYGLSPWDWRSYFAALALLAVAGFAASYVPAWRASRTNPLLVMRGS